MSNTARKPSPAAMPSRSDPFASLRSRLPIVQRRRPRQLKGRTALVTGASRGIGRAIAHAPAQEGADVSVNYVSSERQAKEVVDLIGTMGRKAMLAQADVADFPDTFRMAQDVLREFGHLDILINNAGINSEIGRAHV